MAALEDLQDSTGYQRQPFLKRLLPRQVGRTPRLGRPLHMPCQQPARLPGIGLPAVTQVPQASPDQCVGDRRCSHHCRGLFIDAPVVCVHREAAQDASVHR